MGADPDRPSPAVASRRARHPDVPVVVAVGLFVALGLPDGVLGTVWPSLRDDLGASQSGLGFLAAAATAGYVAASLASGRLAARLGPGSTLAAGAAVGVVALTGIATSPAWAAVVAAHLLLGVSLGTVDAGGNAWMALARGPGPLHLLHAGFGVGATTGPLVATLFVADADPGRWRWAYASVVVVQLTALVAVVATRHRFAATSTRVAARGGAAPTGHPGGGDQGGDVSRRRLLTLVLVWFAVYVGAEVAVGQWTFTVFTEGRGWRDTHAGVLVATYWGGLLAGRVVVGIVGERLDLDRLQHRSTLVAAAAAVVLWLDPAGAGWMSVPVLGLGFATLFPLMVNRTPSLVGRDATATTVGRQLAASAAGMTGAPLAIGILADRRGIQVAPVAVVVLTVALTLVWGAIRRLEGAGTPR